MSTWKAALMGAVGVGAGVSAAAWAEQRRRRDPLRSKIVIVGGGTAGIDVAARLCRQLANPDVTIIDPAEQHSYQPGWTLVAAGVFPKKHFDRAEASLIPRPAVWIRERVASFEPEADAVILESGKRIGYDYLVVAAGHQLDYAKVDGVEGRVGRNGLYSNYTGDGATATWRDIRSFEGGTALFVEPKGPIKCGGAPQKIAYLADSHWRRSGVRDRIDQRFVTGKPVIFGSPYYRPALEEVMRRKAITPVVSHNLVSVDPDQKIATFDTGEGDMTMDYDFLHFCPPQSAPDFIKASALADASGYVEVDSSTLQHKRFPNVFGLGDSSNLPTSKTGAAIRKQAPVVVHNLLRHAAGADLAVDSLEYHGYSSCPVVTDYGKMMLAEFDYSLKPTPTLPPWDHDSRVPTYANWLIKTRALPVLYWQGMMRGLA
ncbi:FAD/NAD(P)-binding oxidoreductase [Microbacterium sp. SCN 69-37]|uniref:NAD(P)/FAD-dependent oxidoreductase n=1 Tax=Microbacterium sp. SCN 69-37 TaxID=1660115 RepID=UPI0025F97D78|nr:FAD/NAD(P)-binding oxidoreductase [Microbacterium sp. SCN 69-37]